MLIIEIKVTPSSGRQVCTLDKSGQLKCFLKSPPEKNKANEELITLLAHSLKVGKEKIKITSGLTGRKKMVKIDATLTLEQVLAALGIEAPMLFW